MLADAIDFPIVFALGLVTFGPLTLAVSLVEAFVFRRFLRVTVRQVYPRVLLANTASTLAGGVVFLFQDVLIHATHVHDSIPSFVSGYRWLAPVLVLIYYAKSVAVEGSIVSTRRFSAHVARPRGALFKTVLLANIASYLLVGPLFYFVTRPTFGHLDLRWDTTWTANPRVQAYFIDPRDRFVKRVSMNGQDAATVMPFPCTDFLVQGGGGTFAYRGTDGHLYLLRPGEPKPICACRFTKPFFMQSVSLSPDGRKLAYAVPGPGPAESNSFEVLELDTQTTTVIPDLLSKEWGPIVAWSKDGSRLLLEMENDQVAVVGGEQAWPYSTSRPASSVEGDELVEAYVRHGKHRGYSGGLAQVWFYKDTSGEYEVTCYQGLAGGVRVSRAGKPVLVISNDYGLLKLGFRWPESPTFLPNGTELLLEWWGQLYLLDIERRRMGLLTAGENYVLIGPRFRVGFSELLSSE